MTHWAGLLRNILFSTIISIKKTEGSEGGQRLFVMESRVEVAGIHHRQDVSHLQVFSGGMEGKMDLAGMQHLPPVQLGLLSLSVTAEFQVIESHIWCLLS